MYHYLECVHVAMLVVLNWESGDIMHHFTCSIQISVSKLVKVISIEL